MQDNSNSKKTKILIICGVLLIAAVSAMWTLSVKPLNNHECFVSITSREMLASGDWVWPTCNGEPRLAKTPLSYWLVASLAQVTGKIDEFTTRLPSALAGILSVAAILYFVSRILSFRIAVISSCVWATTLSYFRYSHNARPEMVLMLFITLCFLSFYAAVTADTRRRQVVYMLTFWISFALANMAKGPAPLPLVLVPLFFYVVIFRKWKFIARMLPIVGPIVFLAVVIPWPLAIAGRLNWDLVVWKREFVDRFFGSYGSSGKPVYYYFLIMFQFIIPWVAFLPSALAAPFFKVWHEKRLAMQFLWLWFVVGLVFITVSAGKRQHYILPMMPAMAILIGIIIEDMAFSRKAHTIKNAADTLRYHVIVLIGGAVGGTIYLALKYPEMVGGAIILAILTIITVGSVAFLFVKGKPAYACGSLFGGIIILVMLSYVSFFNPLNYNEPSRHFTLNAAKKVPKADKLIAYKSASTRFIHYFGRQVPKVQSKEEAHQLYEQGVWIVAFGQFLDELLENNDLEIVYIEENAERHQQNKVAGALLHKSKSEVQSGS